MKKTVKKAGSSLFAIAMALLLLAQPVADVAYALDAASTEPADFSTTVTGVADTLLDSATTITVTPDVPEDTYDPDADTNDDQSTAQEPIAVPSDDQNAAVDSELSDPEPDEDTTAPDTETKQDKIISAFDYPEQVWYAEEYDLDAINAILPATVDATLADGSTVALPATWILRDQDAQAFADDPSTVDLLEYHMALPDGYVLSNMLDTGMMPDVLVSFKLLRDDTANSAARAANNEIALQAGSITVSTIEDHTNLVLNSSGTFGTRFEHRFDDDNVLAYCIAQGKANPNGRKTYYYSGDANQSIAAVLDTGYPRYTTIGGYSLTADQARQATQFAIWCFTNDQNRNTVTVSGMRARKNDEGASNTYNAGVWLVNYANTHSSTGIYHIWSPDDTDYQPVVSAANSYVPPQTGTLYVQKHSNTSSIPTTGSYSLQGALYAIYSDAACTNKLGELKTGSDGKTSGMTVNAGTYYAKEVCAPNNYALHTEVYGVYVAAGGSGTIDAWDQPITGTITIQKSSTNTGISNGNSNYSLAGAYYYVYNSSGTHVATLVTDANGKASRSGFWVDTYTIKEIEAPLGFKLSSTTYKATVSQASYASTTAGNFELAIQYQRNGYLYGRITSSNIGKYASYRFPTWCSANGQDDIVWYEGYNAGNGTTYHFDTYLGRHTNSNDTLNVHCYGYTSSGAQEGVAALAVSLDFGNPNVSVAVSDSPATGYVQINKSSSNPELTNGNSAYSLAGAVYGVYADAACTAAGWRDTLTTDANGNAKSKALPLGTYYVKEATAPPGYKLDRTVHTVQITQSTTQSTSWYNVTYNTRGLATLDVFQVPDGTASVKFPTWSDANGQDDIVWYDANHSGSHWTRNFHIAEHSYIGTYISHVYYYNSSGTAIRSDGLSWYATLDNLTATLAVTDEPEGGWLEIQKASSMPDITDGNSCYSLQGAVYGVYSNAACTTELTRLTTNADGYAKSDMIRDGKVYVKEITAPEGYELDEQVYTVTIKAGETVKLSVEDEPGNDPVGIQLTKIQKYPNQYIPSLEGAEFTVKYYDGQYATTADLTGVTPTRTWVIATKARTTSSGEIVYQTRLDTPYLVSGDALYKMGSDVVTLPIGTVTIQETKAPEGYAISGGFLNDSSGNSMTDENGVVLLHVTQDGLGDTGSLVGGNYYTQQEEFQLCSLTLIKKDNGGNLLEGAKFKLQILNPETNEYDDLDVGTTDANGQIKFSDLVFGRYRIIELETADGASLMADPIEVTLPVTTEQDAGGSEPTYTIDGTNYYCDVTFTIQNGVIVVPSTGSLGKLPAIFAGFGTLGLAAAAYITFRRKRFH